MTLAAFQWPLGQRNGRAGRFVSTQGTPDDPCSRPKPAPIAEHVSGTFADDRITPHYGEKKRNFIDEFSEVHSGQLRALAAPFAETKEPPRPIVADVRITHTRPHGSHPPGRGLGLREEGSPPLVPPSGLTEVIPLFDWGHPPDSQPV